MIFDLPLKSKILSTLVVKPYPFCPILPGLNSSNGSFTGQDILLILRSETYRSMSIKSMVNSEQRRHFFVNELLANSKKGRAGKVLCINLYLYIARHR